MPAYWWECDNENCRRVRKFGESGSSRLFDFFWDRLRRSGWDQKLLSEPCNHCNAGNQTIRYKFPRKEEINLRVLHIVGLDPGEDGDYLPMMWETAPDLYPGETWFDFKFLTKSDHRKYTLGLNRPAVFKRQDLQKLFGLYCEKTRTANFP